MPGVGAADSVRTTLGKTPLLMPLKLLTRSVVSHWSSDLILRDISHMLLVLRAINMDHYIGIPTSRVPRLQIGVGICAVLTADTVVTGKVNCYKFIVQLRSFQQFVVVLVQYQVLFDTDRYLNFVRYSILTL